MHTENRIGEAGSTAAPVSLLFLSAGLFFLSHGLQATLVPIQASLNGFCTHAVGFTAVGLFLGYTLGNLAILQFSFWLGYMRSFLLCSVALCMSWLLYVFSNDVLYWAFVRFLNGFALAGSVSVLATWINSVIEKTRYRRHSFSSLGLSHIVQFLMIGLGQLVFCFCDLSPPGFFALGAAIALLALVPVIFATRLRVESDALQIGSRMTLDFARCWRILPCSFLAILLSGIVSGQFWAFGALFVWLEECNKTCVAVFVSLSAISGAAAIAFFSHVLVFRDRRILMLMQALLVLTSSLSVVVADYFLDHVLLWLGSSIFGAFAFSLYTVSHAHINAYAKERGLEFSGLTETLELTYCLGSVFGPLLSSLITCALNISRSNLVIFLVPMCTSSLFIAFSLLHMLRHPTEAAAPRDHYR